MSSLYDFIKSVLWVLLKNRIENEVFIFPRGWQNTMRN